MSVCPTVFLPSQAVIASFLLATRGINSFNKFYALVVHKPNTAKTKLVQLVYCLQGLIPWVRRSPICSTLDSCDVIKMRMRGEEGKKTP